MRAAIVMAAVGVLAAASPAWAQTTRSTDLRILAGVSFLSFEASDFTGFKVDVSKVAGVLNRGSIDVFGEFDWQTDAGLEVLGVRGGPQISITPSDSRATFFARFGVGIVRISTPGFGETDLTFVPGGGVGYALGDSAGLFGQFDIVIVKVDGGTQIGQRFAAGVVFRR